MKRTGKLTYCPPMVLSRTIVGESSILAGSGIISPENIISSTNIEGTMASAMTLDEGAAKAGYATGFDDNTWEVGSWE